MANAVELLKMLTNGWWDWLAGTKLNHLNSVPPDSHDGRKVPTPESYPLIATGTL